MKTIFLFTHPPSVLGLADALAMEGTSPVDYANKSDANRMIEVVWASDVERRSHNNDSSQTNVSKFKMHMTENSIPFFLLDIIDPQRTAHKWGVGLMAGFAAIEVGAGVWAAEYIREKLKEGRHGITRRQMLIGLGASAIAAKGALIAADAATILELIPEIAQKKHSAPSELLLKVRELAEKYSPEMHTILDTFRNAVWAHKLSSSIVPSLRREKPTRPEVAMRLGAGHAGFESMIKADPKQRLSYIRSVWEILSTATNIKSSGVRISSIARFDPSPSGVWSATEAYRDPELEEIEHA